MRCINPGCNYPKTSVTNSRPQFGGRLHLRRHCCHKCKTRYTTYESILYDRDAAPHWFDELGENSTDFE